MDRALTRDDSPIGFRLALAALAVLLAWATYRWVEKPLRFTRRLPLRQVFTGAAVAAMVLMLAALGLARMHLLPADIQALVERTRSDRPANMARCHYSLDATVARLSGADCHSARGPAPRVAIWGDSHVLAWQPFAWKLARLSQVSEVLVMGPVPDLPMPADQCIAAGRLVDCVTPRLHFERSSARAPRILSGIVARFPNARLIDPTDHFCGPDVCPAMKDGRALFWDHNHVASSAAEAFAAAYLADPARYTSAAGVAP